jgi:uncharacterized protein YbaR (Trm112 family)
MPLDDWVREILVCPESKKPLIHFDSEGFLFCPASRLRYRVDDGIPVLLVEEAERVEEEESRRLLADAKERGLPGAQAYD